MTFSYTAQEVIMQEPRITETQESSSLLSRSKHSTYGGSASSRYYGSGYGTNQPHYYRIAPSRMQCVRSKGPLLLLIWNMLIFSYFGAQNHVLYEVLGDGKPYNWVFSNLLIRAVFLVMFYPVAGWIADVFLGRYKTIRTALWLMWLGAFFLVIGLLLKYLSGGPRAVHVTLSSIAFLLMNIGLAGFQANVIPFGTDQLHDASAEEISSFIHWLFWTEYFGFGLVTYFVSCIPSLSEEESTLLQGCIEFVCLSVVLVLDFFCKQWLIMEPQNQNPLKTIAGVLQYAAQNKYPRQRSAFTYHEDDIPSRVDLGMQKYGGPYTTEEVEDVKTLFHVLMLLSVLGVGIVVRIGADNVVDLLFSSLDGAYLPGGEESANYCYGSQVVQNVTLWVIIIGIPLHQLLIYPLFHNYIPSMLKRIGLGIIVAIASIVGQLSIDLAGHLKTTNDNATFCIFTSLDANDSSLQLDVDYRWIILPYLLNGLMRMLILIPAFEFICAQSPHHMKGLLIGTFYGLRGVFIILACMIILAFYLGFSSNPSVPISCGFWYYVVNLVIGLGGMAAYCIVAKKYRNRVRDEVTNERTFAERYFDKYSDNPL